MPAFHPIVLLTDFGTRDAYVASMKGVILSIFPRATMIDLTHEIEPQNLIRSAFLLEAAYPYFPAGSIFVSVVDPGVGSERRILAAKTRRGIFLAPDNGILTRVLAKEKPEELRTVTNPRFFLKKVSSTFHGRDCFSPTAARLAKNPSCFSQLGPVIQAYKRLPFPEPKAISKGMRGEIVFFDRFGNAFTNLSQDFLKNKPDRVLVKNRSVGKLRRSYYEVKKGKALAVMSSSGLLEIAVNQGSAKDQLKLSEGDRVEVVQAR